MTTKKKFKIGDRVRHELTGQEATVRQIFGRKIFLSFWFGRKSIIDWYDAKGWQVYLSENKDVLPSIVVGMAEAIAIATANSK